jgi:hypothetical protein
MYVSVQSLFLLRVLRVVCLCCAACGVSYQLSWSKLVPPSSMRLGGAEIVGALIASRAPETATGFPACTQQQSVSAASKACQQLVKHVSSS